MTNACVIGWGTVGKATAETFNIDKYYSRSSNNISLEEASKCEYIFICLPTPVQANGDYYVEDITKIISELSKFSSFEKSVVIIRSTVYPGYNLSLRTEYGWMNIVSNPEFLSEDTWKEDALKPQLVVIGADNANLRDKVAALYRGRFKYNEPVVTDSVTAEFIKISLNAFFTAKVVFANQLYDYSRMINANYETVKDIIESHLWGSKNHFTVFHKGGRGAGGKCLRKDIKALAHLVPGSFFGSIYHHNELYVTNSNKT